MDTTRRVIEGNHMGDKMFKDQNGWNLYIQYARGIIHFDLNQLHVDELLDIMKNDIKSL
jgi:hypothetical protein